MENYKIQILQSELDRVIQWIQFADKKTAFLSVYYSAVPGLVINKKSLILQKLLVYNGLEIFIYSLVLICLGIFFISGIFFLFYSVFPRLKNLLTDKSLFYFGHVSKMKFIDYREEVDKMNESEIVKQIIEQIYTNSVIANQKMKNVQNSTKSFFVTTFFIILLILL